VATLRDFEVPPHDREADESRGIPEGAEALGRRLGASDAFMLASPESNGSMPGAIKNLIDWTSHIRPQPFDGHHALLLSASVGVGGPAFRGGGLADETLRGRLEQTVRDFLALAEAAKEYPLLKRAVAERETADR